MNRELFFIKKAISEIILFLCFLPTYLFSQNMNKIDNEVGVIAYCYQPTSGSEFKKIFRINENGTNNIQVGNLPLSVNGPKWSPDGNKIVIYGYPSPSTWSIYLMNSNGSNFIRLTETEDVWDNSPSWSPYGTKIVFTRTYPNLNGREEVWVMDANGDNKYWTGIEGGGAKWSPNNLRFVYHSNRSGNFDIYTSNIDGTDEIRLTFSSSLDLQPEWSPDGQKIAFSSDRNGNFDIYLINSDGAGGLFNLTNNSADDFTPNYSPNGTKIAFESDLDNPATNHSEIYTINVNGTNLNRVTTTPTSATAINPDWFPIDSTAGIGIEFNFSLENFALFQNYPNPFNPSTKISYQISNSGFVSLKVYDIIGNELVTLVNQEKQAGKYEIGFNADGFPSGIYFCCLQVAGYERTIKMLLLK